MVLLVGAIFGNHCQIWPCCIPKRPASFFFASTKKTLPIILVLGHMVVDTTLMSMLKRGVEVLAFRKLKILSHIKGFCLNTPTWDLPPSNVVWLFNAWKFDVWHHITLFRMASMHANS